MTDRNDELPEGARGQTAKRLKLRMPWDDWFDLSAEERAQKESAVLDYLEDTYSEEDFRGVIAMFESGYKDAIVLGTRRKCGDAVRADRDLAATFYAALADRRAMPEHKCRAVSLGTYA